MKHTWNGIGSLDSGLREVLQGAQPSSELLRILDIYGSLAMSVGRPFGFTYLGEALQLFAPGLVLHDIDGLTSFDDLRTECQRSWRKTHDHSAIGCRIPLELMAEGSAAALLKRVGWQAQKLKSSKHERRPDLVATRGQEKVEVEVVASEIKDDERSRQSAVAERLNELPRRDDATAVVHILDTLSDDEAEQVSSAIQRLSVGVFEEERDRWRVTIVPADEQSGAHPSWWPKQYFQYFATMIDLAPVSKRVTVLWGVSYRTYRNSPLRKIERNQFSGKCPALIAWDTADLKGGVKWLAENGHEMLGDFNNHISGILGFALETWIDGRVSWRYHLIENKHAATPLPSQLFSSSTGEVSVPLFTCPV